MSWKHKISKNSHIKPRSIYNGVEKFVDSNDVDYENANNDCESDSFNNNQGIDTKWWGGEEKL